MRTTILSIVTGLGFAFAATFAVAQDDQGLSKVQIDRAVQSFDSGAQVCANADAVYRLDCFQQVFSRTARVFGRASAYWEADVALTRVSRNLFSFVRANTHEALGRQKMNGSRVKPITEASVPEATALYRTNVDRAAADLVSGSKYEADFFRPISDVILKYSDALN
ncbi:hypothetical protein [Shimia abyssi]|uniref:Uncharacterized protein n=1 Tax=Shimia abyssi TaxID=1662395 RepID=A0A2P8F8V5_9RHOB|nr:hypothetical protein [Shimia abyssi]PSL18153.1 hypothetical protein CLV88_11277 [Shimia abyssi]